MVVDISIWRHPAWILAKRRIVDQTIKHGNAPRHLAPGSRAEAQFDKPLRFCASGTCIGASYALNYRFDHRLVRRRHILGGGLHAPHS